MPATYRPLTVRDLDEPWRRPIGRPLAGLWAVVADPAGRPVPVGVPGELRVGGGAAGRGYRGRPALTAERFVPDPLAAEAGEPGARTHRTGVLVRRRPDGDLEHLGRTDQPAEARDQGLQYVEVQAFPPPPERDRRAEAPPRRPADALAGDGVGAGDGVAPEGAIEEGLAEIFAEVLERGSIGVTDDFFRVGGHSLAGAQVMLRVRERFDVDLPVRTLFEARTVRALAREMTDALAGQALDDDLDALLDGALDDVLDGEWGDDWAGEEDGSDGSIVAAARAREGADAPLSYAQERLWFLEQMDPGRPVYAMPGAARVRGALDPARLASAIAGVVARHEALRTVFPIRGARAVQEARPPFAPALPAIDLSGLPEAIRERQADRLAVAEARRPFDLQAGPLFRTALLRLGTGPDGDENAGDHVILVTFHHIVSDGWSVAIFLKEMAAFYAGEEAAPLPRLPIQYADYAVWQRERLAGERLEAGLGWWAEHLAGAPAVLELPTDRPRPPRPTQRGEIVPFSQGRDEAVRRGERLTAAARSLDATPFMILMAAVNAFLYRYTGQDDLVVGTPVAGRDKAEAEGLIGFFVNTLVLRTAVDGGASFGELLGRVREESLAAFARQESRSRKLVEALRPERDASHTPLFQVMLVADPGWIRTELAGLPGQSLEPFLPDAGVAKFDLTFRPHPRGRRREASALELALEASLDLFDRATAERMAAALRDPAGRRRWRRPAGRCDPAAAVRGRAPPAARRVERHGGRRPERSGARALPRRAVAAGRRRRRTRWPSASRESAWTLRRAPASACGRLAATCGRWASGRTCWSASRSSARRSWCSASSACSGPAAPGCRSTRPTRRTACASWSRTRRRGWS